MATGLPDPNKQPVPAPPRPMPGVRDFTTEPWYAEYKNLARRREVDGPLTPDDDSRRRELEAKVRAEYTAATPAPLPAATRSDPLAAAVRQPLPPLPSSPPQPSPAPPKPSDRTYPDIETAFDPQPPAANEPDRLGKSFNNPGVSNPGPPAPPVSPPPSPPAGTPPGPDGSSGKPPAPPDTNTPDGAAGKPLDVNVIGPLPVPVEITNWDAIPVKSGPGTPSGTPGGNGDTGGGGGAVDHDAYGNPVDPEHKPLAGMTVNEAFQKFSGGYAAGYPIHNLAQLKTNLTGIDKTFEKATGFGIGKALRATKRKLFGPAKKTAAGGKLGGQPGKKGTAGTVQDVRIVAPLPIPVTVTDLPAGSQSKPDDTDDGSGTGAKVVAGAAATAVFGPLGGAAVALGAALAAASQEVYSFARAQEEEVRRLGEFNAALATSVAVLDIRRLERDIAMGAATEGTSEQLTKDINEFEEALAPLQEAATNLANVVGGTLLDLVTDITMTVNTVIVPVAHAITAFINWFRNKEDTSLADADETAWTTFERMAADLDRAGRRSWPGAAPPPAPWGGRP